MFTEKREKPTKATIIEDWTFAHPTYCFTTSKTVKSVQINPSKLMADVNLNNDSFIYSIDKDTNKLINSNIKKSIRTSSAINLRKNDDSFTYKKLTFPVPAGSKLRSSLPVVVLIWFPLNSILSNVVKLLLEIKVGVLT